MADAESLEELAHPEYWDKRYGADTDEAKTYEWLRRFDTLKPFLLNHLPPPTADGPQILHLGNGNSTLPFDLETLNYTSQTAIDFSAVVTAHMQSLLPAPSTLDATNTDKPPPITFLTMDIRALTFPANTFDICLDKGTLDSLLSGSPWQPPPHVQANVKKYVDEVERVLRPGGKWLYVTWRQPHFIRGFLERDGVFEVGYERIGESAGVLEYFGWVVKKL